METVSERLDYMMKKKGVNQVELAKLTGISQGRITNIVTGKTKDPQGTTIMKICKALDINPFWLIMGWGEEDNASQTSNL